MPNCSLARGNAFFIAHTSFAYLKSGTFCDMCARHAGHSPAEKQTTAEFVQSHELVFNEKLPFEFLISGGAKSTELG